jgi:hyperosmotically inducible protein
MKVLFALVVGVLVGAAAVWILGTSRGRDTAQTAGDQIANGTKSARDAIQDKLKVLDLRSDDIKDELAKTGQVVRRKAKQAGEAIADATADATITTKIKGKFIASKDLSALNISVNTTGGVVTLSGSVQAPDDISKAMLLAMETDGVREVISTLQVKPKPAKPG